MRCIAVLQDTDTWEYTASLRSRLWSFICQVIYRHWLRLSEIRWYGLIKHYHYTKKYCGSVWWWHHAILFLPWNWMMHLVMYLHYTVFHISSNKYDNTMVYCVSEIALSDVKRPIWNSRSGKQWCQFDLDSGNILIKTGIMWDYWCASISSDKRNDSLLQQ